MAGPNFTWGVLGEVLKGASLEILLAFTFPGFVGGFYEQFILKFLSSVHYFETVYDTKRVLGSLNLHQIVKIFVE